MFGFWTEKRNLNTSTLTFIKQLIKKTMGRLIDNNIMLVAAIFKFKAVIKIQCHLNDNSVFHFQIV